MAYCTESVFSFLCAAVGQKWVVLKDIILHHFKSVDGATCGFDHTGPRGDNKNNLFSDLDIYEICSSPEALASGFGYEEMQGILLHDPSKYNKDGSCRDPRRLKKFIKNNMYLDEKQFSYSNIKHKFMPSYRGF